MRARIAFTALVVAAAAAAPAAAQSSDQIVFGTDLSAPVAGTIACGDCLVYDVPTPPMPWAGVLTQAQAVLGGGAVVELSAFGSGISGGYQPVAVGTGAAAGTGVVALSVAPSPFLLPGQMLTIHEFAPASVAYTAASGAAIAQAILTGHQPATAAATDARLLFQATVQRVPVPQGITPPTGDLTGGTRVTITGYNFDLATGVTFGGVPATSWQATPPASPTEQSTITAVTPPGAAGIPDIRVLGAPGVPTLSFKGSFTYAGCVVPELRGDRWNAAARRQITGASCRVGAVRWRGKRGKRSRVVSMRPAPGGTYAVGTPVNVVVAGRR